MKEMSINFRQKLNHLSHEELIDLLYQYDKFVQNLDTYVGDPKGFPTYSLEHFYNELYLDYK